MNPVQKYLKNLLAKNRVIGRDHTLNGLVKADMILDHLVNEKKVPGLSITVLKDGKTILQKGYGYADLENQIPVDPTQTMFRIASVSKPIAATALAHLVADGEIDLDASFYEYVPYYPQKKWDFTIRQLASHTAGIRGYRGMEYGLNQSYTIKEGTTVFKDDDLIYEPGQGYGYNSFDWVLVSLAIQEATGIPFEQYVQQKVLYPLGLKNTFAESRPARRRELGGNRETGDSRVAGSDREAGDSRVVGSDREAGSNRESGSDQGAEKNPIQEKSTAFDKRQNDQHLTKFYSKNRLGFRPAIPVNNFYKLAGGGYLSTSEDIAKFGQAYLVGTILPEAIRAQFLTSQTIKGKPTYYGLGWQVSEDTKGRKFYGHVGNGVGGYSNFFVYPEEQMVFAVLVNCTDPKIQDELDDVVDTLIDLHRNINL
ncbi:MAG: serine hydrolase domain-containing protein [Pricia sp.]